MLACGFDCTRMLALTVKARSFLTDDPNYLNDAAYDHGTLVTQPDDRRPNC